MTASLELSRRHMTPSPPTVSSSHSRKVDTNHDAIRYSWEMVPAGGGEPDSIGTTSPSSVPTAASSVTISSSISLRRRAEPETGQPGSRICESRSPIHETEPPEIASARSSSPAGSLPDDNAPVGLLVSVGERSRAEAATSRLLGQRSSLARDHASAGGVPKTQHTFPFRFGARTISAPRRSNSERPSGAPTVPIRRRR